MSWPAPDPHNQTPCPVMRAWIGVCGETDRTKCQHFTYLKKRGAQARCSCGRPALGECGMASSFVCGAPICTQSGYCTSHGGRCRF